MKTPICDFVEQYVGQNKLRLHMPGHKGKEQLGFERFDITEIAGADSLYHASGIIRESEENATELFGSGATFYSTEGSSHVIRAMLYLAKTFSDGSSNRVIAARNAHSSFISACALNDIDVDWLYPEREESYLSCNINAEKLEKVLGKADKTPICVYVTSPDYLGNMCDIAALSEVCRRYGTMLVVDNAHGAYLKFLKEDMHPISLGATMCCDSAHKTLPVLTGGAYLHIGRNADAFFKENAKSALALFGSTSPSYLTLMSLDRVNAYISQGYCERLQGFVSRIQELTSGGGNVCEQGALREPMKIVIRPKRIGYRGEDFADELIKLGIVCEFCDDEYVVLMPSPDNGEDELLSLFDAIGKIEKREEIADVKTAFEPPLKRMTPRQAMFSKCETVAADAAFGRVLARSCVSCPPAVSLIVSGEEFNRSVIDECKKHGFDSFCVVKE